MSDLMIDIETLGVTPDSVILTIGAQGFEPISGEVYPKQTFYRKIEIDSQDRYVDDSTVEWWGQQAEDVREEAFGEEGRIPLEDALDELHSLAWNANRLWANGIAFDFTILENAYKSFNKPIPWQYYKVMDARTVYKIAGAGKLGNSHNALEDCLNQIILLRDSFEKLEIKRL